MNTIQTVTKDIITSEKLPFGLSEKTNFFRKTLTIEKNISMDWAYNLYKGSIVDSFWSVLSSPVE